MRTSKKLLSFFLAVVMVITTCSVGFTAFAKDYDSMWKNSADKQAAFDTLNDLVSEYVPSLIIGASGDIANNVYAKYAAGNTTPKWERPMPASNPARRSSNCPKILSAPSAE